MIEALGVPHTEVAIVLINGERCGLDKMLHNDDMISVYPTFMQLDGVEVQSPAPLPPGRPRFIADAHVGALARMLRMAGFDTLYDNHYDDPDIAAIAGREQRIVLTRDRDLLKRRSVAHGCYVHPLKAPEQFRELVQRLRLQAQARPFTLCLHCNTPLSDVEKAQVEQRLPPSVRAPHVDFSLCRQCDRVFWKGSHWKSMCAVLDRAQCGAGCGAASDANA